MANIKLNLDIKSLFLKLTKNLNWLFFAGFIILVIFEIVKISTSVQIILKSSQEPIVSVSKEKGVRINFDNYNFSVNRIKAAGNFSPNINIRQNPFLLGR